MKNIYHLKIKNLIKKNVKLILFLLLIVFAFILLFSGKLSGFLPFLFFTILTFSGVLLFQLKNSKSIHIAKNTYSFIKRYIIAIFYTSIAFLVIAISVSIIPKIFSNDYYLVIDDLPKAYVEKGYSKETIKKYLEIQTNFLNNSDDDNPLMRINEDDGRIKLEAFGNSLYINEFILFLRDVFGYDKTINVQFGLDEEKELFYRGTITNKGKLIFLNKRAILLNDNPFTESQINDLVSDLTIAVLMYAQPRKVISYFRQNGDELSELYNNHISYNIILEKKDVTYFYRVFGNSFFDRHNFFEADIKYRHALKIYDNNNLNRDDEYFKLIESYCLNLHRLGRVSEALSFLKGLKIGNKTLLMIEAYLLNDIGQIEDAEKLYEKSLKKDFFNKDSIYGEYSLFTRKEATKHLLSIYLSKNDYKKASNFAEKSFKEFEDNYFQIELIDIFRLLGEEEKAEELEIQLYNDDIDYFATRYSQLYQNNTMSLFDNNILNEDVNSHEIDYHKYYYYGEINHLFLQSVYPQSRLLVREIINTSKDTSLVSKSYNDYITQNLTDIQIKKEYLNSLLKYKRWNLLKSNAYKILKDGDKNRFDEEVYFYAKSAEISILYNEAQYSTINLDSIVNLTFSDSLYSKLKNPIFKAQLDYMSFLRNEGDDFDFMGALYKLDSVSHNNPVTKELMNFFSASIISNLLTTAFNEENENEINVDSLIVELIKKRGQDKETTILWGISDELKGLNDRANQKYEVASHLNKDFNSYLVAADFFYSRFNYKLSARNYEKAILKDSINVTRRTFQNFTTSFTIANIEKEINYYDYLRYKDLANKYSVKYPLDYCFYQQIYSHSAFNTASDILNNKYEQNNNEAQKLKSLLESAISYGFNPNKFSFYPGYEKSKEVNLIKKIIRESYKDTYKFLECHGGLNYTFVQMNFDKLN